MIVLSGSYDLPADKAGIGGRSGWRDRNELGFASPMRQFAFVRSRNPDGYIDIKSILKKFNLVNRNP